MYLQQLPGLSAPSTQTSDTQFDAGTFAVQTEKALGISGWRDGVTSKEVGGIDWEKLQRQGDELKQQQLLEMSMANAQHMNRQISEARARENTKIEYARRSAEASEEALAEERRKREAAEVEANEARTERAIAEQRAIRAEKREERAMRISLISLVAAVVGLLFAAWPFIKENMGW